MKHMLTAVLAAHAVHLALSHGGLQDLEHGPPGSLQLVLDAQGHARHLDLEEADEAEEDPQVRPALIRRHEDADPGLEVGSLSQLGGAEAGGSELLHHGSSLARAGQDPGLEASYYGTAAAGGTGTDPSSQQVQHPGQQLPQQPGTGAQPHHQAPQPHHHAPHAATHDPLAVQYGHQGGPTPAPPVIALVNFTAYDEALKEDQARNKKEVSGACAALTLGMFAFFLMLYYMVNAWDENIVASTWELIARMMAIFITLNIALSWTILWKAMMKEKEDQVTSSQMLKGAMASSALFVVVFVALPLVMYRLRFYPNKLSMGALFGGSLLGFSGAECGAAILRLPSYTTSVQSYLSGIAVMIIVLWVVLAIASYMRSYIKPDDEEGEMWDLAMEAAEADGYGLLLGLLVSMSIRFGITKQAPTLHEAAEGRTSKDCKILFGAMLASFVLFLLLAICASDRKMSYIGRRVTQITRMTCAMTFGWSLLYWTKWTFWVIMEPKEEIKILLSYVLMALFASALGLVLLVGFVLLADRVFQTYESGVRSLSLPFMLNLAFTWHDVFYLNLKYLSKYALSRSDSNISPHFWHFGLTLIVIVFLTPAFVLFIFPQAEAVKSIYPEMFPEAKSDDDMLQGVEGEHDVYYDESSLTITPEQFAYMTPDQQAQWGAYLARPSAVPPMVPSIGIVPPGPMPPGPMPPGPMPPGTAPMPWHPQPPSPQG